MDKTQFITGFVKNSLGKIKSHGQWSIIQWGNMDVLQFSSYKTPEKWSYHDDKLSKFELDKKYAPKIERLAYRLTDGSILFNSNQLKHIGVKAWGNTIGRWSNEREEQLLLRSLGAIPVPFILFEETNTDVRDFSWVIKPKSEILHVIENRGWNNNNTVEVDRHFSGACVFKISNDAYLFDVDRKELTEHKIFNAFVTKLPAVPDSIDHAYDLLMPAEVKTAIKEKKEVLRQGEFFFIYHSDICPVHVKLSEKERTILKFPPSRQGFNILPENNRNLTWIHDDRAPYGEYPYTDKKPITPDEIEFQKYALTYKRIHEKLERSRFKPGTLGKSTTGSHTVEKYVEKDSIIYASGTVKQQRREHGDLTLTGWYKVVANTGVISWTITGKID